MWTEQQADYAAVYILHFVGGTFLIASWVMDGLSLPSWLYSRPLRAVYAKDPMWPCHAALVAIAWLLLCLTWMAVAPWSTSPTANELSVGEIALTLFIECVVLYLVAALALRCARKMGYELGSSSNSISANPPEHGACEPAAHT